MERERRSKKAQNRGGRSLRDLHAFRRVYLYVKRADKYIAVLVLSFLFLILASSGLFAYLFIQDWTSSSEIFPGMTIDGKPVGGMNRTQAAEYVGTTVVGPLEQSLVLYGDDKEFTLNPKDIDISFDITGMVECAYWSGTGQNILLRMYRRFAGENISKNIPLMMKYNKDKLNSFVSTLSEKLDRSPRNASTSISEGKPMINYARDGLKVNKEKTASAIVAALPKNTRRIPVVTESIQPEITNDVIKYIVVVSLSEHMLYLYQHEDLVDKFQAAVGSPQYPTPTGKFYIVDKEKDPTWVPPKSEWAKDKQPIPPGPGNPLGPYWMALGGGFGIHSTPDPSSLGYSVSHGCIRLSEWSAMQVFNAVSKGTPVFILP